MSLYDHAKAAWLDNAFPESVMMYGPLRSRRGRVLNWIRRRLGLDELQELYAQWPDTIRGMLTTDAPPPKGDTITVHWNTRGTFELEDE